MAGGAFWLLDVDMLLAGVDAGNTVYGNGHVAGSIYGADRSCTASAVHLCLMGSSLAIDRSVLTA
jgi:hypothetical protein